MKNDTDKKLRILLIEDSDDDAELVKIELAEAGLASELHRVETLDAVRTALRLEVWDVVISDYHLPQFDAMTTLRVLAELNLDIPFIVVSNFVGEETAVSVLKAGAHEFVPKDRLFRLAAAINRELKDAANRRERKIALQELRESQRQLQELSNHLQRVREEERAHIARELHDELGQMLTALKVDVSCLRSRVANDPAAVQKLNGMAELLDEIINAARRISADLRPTMLDDLGLRAAIEWLVEEFMNRNEAIHCELDLALDDCEIDNQTATAVFRIVQECLTNIVKHAEASEVSVMVATRDDGIEIAVGDNGTGLPPAPVSGSGYGLMGMRERALALRGSFKLRNTAQGGVLVEAKIPLFQ